MSWRSSVSEPKPWARKMRVLPSLTLPGSEMPLMNQFAAEDGSDRRTWLASRERIDPQPPSPLRTTSTPGTSTTPMAGVPPPPDIAPLLADFAANAMFRQLAAARVCHRDLEFLLDPGDNAMSALPKIAGVIDVLWQDEKHGWHLLAWATEAQPSLAEQWETRRSGLIVRAWGGAAALRRLAEERRPVFVCRGKTVS